MRIDDSTYSRVINWLKILLPILALALLSTLFLVARTVDPAQQLPFAEIDVEELAREERIGAPNFSGVTAEGAAIALSAKTAAPDPESQRRITGDVVEAAIDLPSGERIEITADAMALNYDTGIAELSRSVEISSDSGYSISAADIEIALDRTRVTSASPARVSGEFGTLSANSFELVQSDAAPESYVLVFNGDVKLLYQPDE
ncbi:MAG: hypothetical protein AAGF46_12275 [Pseudomonadota bacterium]